MMHGKVSLKVPTLEVVSVATHKDLIIYLAKNYKDIIWHKVEDGEDLKFNTERHIEENPTEIGSSVLQANVTPIVNAPASIKEVSPEVMESVRKSANSIEQAAD
jgi:hypothetical protein